MCYFPQMQNINDETFHHNPFELLDEDIIEAAPSFNLIDEENDDEELKNIVNFLGFFYFMWEENRQNFINALLE